MGGRHSLGDMQGEDRLVEGREGVQASYPEGRHRGEKAKIDAGALCLPRTTARRARFLSARFRFSQPGAKKLHGQHSGTPWGRAGRLSGKRRRFAEAGGMIQLLEPPRIPGSANSEEIGT